MNGGQWMVVLIVLIAVVGSIMKSKHGARRRPNDAADQVENDRLRTEVRELKDRIQVLERVITDNHGSLGLDREIERLRDR